MNATIYLINNSKRLLNMSVLVRQCHSNLKLHSSALVRSIWFQNIYRNIHTLVYWLLALIFQQYLWLGTFYTSLFLRKCSLSSFQARGRNKKSIKWPVGACRQLHVIRTLDIQLDIEMFIVSFTTFIFNQYTSILSLFDIDRLMTPWSC